MRSPAAVISAIATLLLFAGGFYSAWMFLTVSETNEVIRRGGIAWYLLSSVYLMKVWLWMRMESNRAICEIKRVELQIVRLQSKQIV